MITKEYLYTYKNNVKTPVHLSLIYTEPILIDIPTMGNRYLNEHIKLDVKPPETESYKTNSVNLIYVAAGVPYYADKMKY